MQLIIMNSAMGNLLHNLETSLSPRHTALLVINVSAEENRSALPAEITQKIQYILETARALEVAVLHLETTVRSPDMQVARLDLYHRTLADIGLPARAGEPAFFERHVARAGSKLDAFLLARNIRVVLLIGAETDETVLNVAHTLHAMKYRTGIVEDCVFSSNADLHAEAIQLMRNTLDYVVTSKLLGSVWHRERHTQITETFVSPLGF